MNDLVDFDRDALAASASWRLPVAGGFNLGATVRLLQRRPQNLIDRWENDRYLRAFGVAEGSRLAAVVNTGTIDAPDLRLDIFGGAITDDTARAISASVRWMLGLDVDPAPIDWLVQMESSFAPVAATLRGFRPPCFPGLWETCLAVLPFQQFSLDTGIAILGRLVERFSPPLLLGGRSWFDFPAPVIIADASPAAVSAVGLSRAKAAVLQARVCHALAGDLDAARFQALPTDAALTALQALPGIGPWSASVLLLRGMRRMDVFPPGDTGTARNLMALLGRSTPLTTAETRSFAARFGDRRGYRYFIFPGNRRMADGPGSAAAPSCRPSTSTSRRRTKMMPATMDDDMPGRRRGATADDEPISIVDETSKDSFPASDPPGWATGQAWRPDRQRDSEPIDDAPGAPTPPGEPRDGSRNRSMR